MNETLLLTGGEVLDGTGASAHRADVLVVDGRIATVAPELTGIDARRIDVTGRVVTPGFIDLHSHADLTLLAFPNADSALRQGITTVATGNCGGGAAPLPPGDRALPVAFAHDPAWGLEIDWSSFGEYAARLDRSGVNVAPLVAHGSIRHATMGLQQRRATDDEIAAMRRVLDAALDDGAFGMSTGLEYQPGMWATSGEIRALVERVGRYGRTYATHIRDRSVAHGAATTEAIAAATGTGARLQLSHFASRPNATDEARHAALAALHAALSNGESVGVDTFPEVWGPALLVDLVPPWVLDRDPSDVLARLEARAVRARIESEIEAEPRFLALIAGYAEIFITSVPAGTTTPGTSITTLAEQRCTSIPSAILDTLLEAGRDFRAVTIRHIYATSHDLANVLALGCCSIASDGVVTTGEGAECTLCWNASTYGYTARTIEHFVRGTGFFTLAEAVRRMTSLPASQLGLRDRGTIAVGSHADLVVFDPSRIHDRSRPDDMARHPTGIDYVLVNGHVAADSDGALGGRHGRLLHPSGGLA